ncbi:hypothetical protein VPHK479_0012 [Vibrio phage K479]
MPQAITPEMVSRAEDGSMSEEFIPAVEGAEMYFAYVKCSDGVARLCILDGGRWRLATAQEMMSMLQN